MAGTVHNSTLGFDAIVKRAQDRLTVSKADPVSWGTLLAAGQYRTLYEQLIELSPVVASTPLQLLDWGAGKGSQMGVAADLGFQVTGVEFSEPRTYKTIKAEFGDRVEFVQLSDPKRLPFPDNSFDVVLSMGVLEHVRETGGSEAASVSEIARVLRPGGSFVCLHFPQRSSWVEFFARNLRLPVHHHLYRYSQSDVKVIADSASLVLGQQWRYGFLPRNQAARLFGSYSNHPRVVTVFDRIDALASRAMPALCTNHGFVARVEP